MSNTIYTGLSRQAGLKTEFDIIANNIANANTTGFRSESLLFSEFIRSGHSDTGSISMTDAGARHIDLSQAALRRTGGDFDLAIEGPGFFQLEGAGGPLLTRAGAFARNEAGEIVTPDGRRLLDAGGAPIFVPPNARDVGVAPDGTLSADGVPVAVIGLVQPGDPTDLTRVGQTAFAVAGDLAPAENSTLQQGFVETSNVNPMAEVARMIEVQRRYEAAKSFVDREHDRIKTVIETLGR